MVSPAQVYVVVPAYNEGRVIGRVVADVRRAGYTAVVVDDVPEEREVPRDHRQRELRQAQRQSDARVHPHRQGQHPRPQSAHARVASAGISRSSP